jgi:hypothetical protein
MRANKAVTFITTALFLTWQGIFCSAFSAQDDFQKGMCFVSWEKERYLSDYSDRSLERLAATGTEWVAIVTTWYQEKFDAKKISANAKTPSDASIIHAIKKAHQLGLKVMLKPHLDLINTQGNLWRGDIGFQKEADWQEWFKEYLKFILHYAKIACDTDVDIFCIGTELGFASQKSQYWQEKIIPEVRSIYQGKLIYAANWDEYSKVKFWQDLDFIGIDAYFPLVESNSPDYAELKNSWVKLAEDLSNWQKSINKPVIFTEIGYRSCESTASNPWDYSYSGKLNLQLQADCYRAALDVLLAQKWCKGLYWWYWEASIYAGGMNNRDFTPQNKPAEQILAQCYQMVYY